MVGAPCQAAPQQRTAGCVLPAGSLLRPKEKGPGFPSVSAPLPPSQTPWEPGTGQGSGLMASPHPERKPAWCSSLAGRGGCPAGAPSSLLSWRSPLGDGPQDRLCPSPGPPPPGALGLGACRLGVLSPPPSRAPRRTLSRCFSLPRLCPSPCPREGPQRETVLPVPCPAPWLRPPQQSSKRAGAGGERAAVWPPARSPGAPPSWQ